MLLFKKKFMVQIRSGEKTQTIRLWKHRMLKPGQRSFIQGIGYIHITSVEPVELDVLTDADAILDGFPTADELRDELCSLYSAESLAKLRPYIIRFSAFTPSEQQAVTEEKRKQLGSETRQLFLPCSDF